MLNDLVFNQPLTHSQTQSIERVFAALSEEVEQLNPEDPNDQRRLSEIQELASVLNSTLRNSIELTQEHYSRHILR